jgi:hypothetical protein
MLTRCHRVTAVTAGQSNFFCHQNAKSSRKPVKTAKLHVAPAEPKSLLKLPTPVGIFGRGDALQGRIGVEVRR